jgi:hypothetical protein
MSQPAVGQSQRNEPIGGDSRTTPNGIESTNYDETTDTDKPHFGIFHVQVEREVQRFRDGLGTLGGAVAELTKIFSQYGKVVKAADQHWEKDQVLEEEIHNLKVENDGIWKHIEKDRKMYKKQMSDLQKGHEGELSKLQAQANAGEQQRKKYEEMERTPGGSAQRSQAKHGYRAEGKKESIRKGKRQENFNLGEGKERIGGRKGKA